MLSADIILFCKNLTILRAEFCPRFASDTLLISLACQPDLKLERLILNDCDVSTFGISVLAARDPLHYFTEIDVRRNKEVGAEGYNILATICTTDIDGVPKAACGPQPGKYFMDKRSMAEAM